MENQHQTAGKAAEYRTMHSCICKRMGRWMFFEEKKWGEERKYPYRKRMCNFMNKTLPTYVDQTYVDRLAVGKDV